MEQEPKVYTRRRRRNTPLFSTRTTSETQQMQQSHNQVEELPRSEPTNEGQHMNQQIKSPSKFACTGKMGELVDYHILTTILPCTHKPKPLQFLAISPLEIVQQ